MKQKISKMNLAIFRSIISQSQVRVSPGMLFKDQHVPHK